MLLEPRPFPAAARRRPPQGAATRTPSFHLNVFTQPNARSGLASAGLAACLVGLLGTDGGIVWIVAGVWTVRAACGRPVGLAWGTACLVAAVRWGTMSLGDLHAATRLVGSTVTAGSVGVRAGLVAVLAGALLDEARLDGLHGRSWGERAAAIAALVAVAAVFVVPGSRTPDLVGAAWWAGTTAAAVAVVGLSGQFLRQVPEWAPFLLVAAGAVLANLTS